MSVSVLLFTAVFGATFDEICDEMPLNDLPASLKSLSELKSDYPARYEEEGLPAVETQFRDDLTFNSRLKLIREQSDENPSIRLQQLRDLKALFPRRFGETDASQLELEIEASESVEMMSLMEWCKVFSIPDTTKFKEVKSKWETMVANWENDVVFIKFYKQVTILLHTLDGEDAERMRNFMTRELEDKLERTERRMKEKEQKREGRRNQSRKEIREVTKQNLLAKGNALPEIRSLRILKNLWERLVAEWYDEEFVKRNYLAVMQELESCKRVFGDKGWFVQFEAMMKDYIPKMNPLIRENEKATPMKLTPRHEVVERKRKRE